MVTKNNIIIQEAYLNILLIIQVSFMFIIALLIWNNMSTMKVYVTRDIPTKKKAQMIVLLLIIFLKISLVDLKGRFLK
ncbi:hypothetical protein I872_02330 [Streptococcus cristatus AS 1.3089]|uniref:Uncharacterized protein n=1 Tax=Streptococcus cristatus AS 1.3089 TaxID=1302863 RepID=A0ABM5NIG2_STRCR|nr:hypothetical protein I872_02330 [Streptococcus cristatus AS 1.3089]